MEYHDLFTTRYVLGKDEDVPWSSMETFQDHQILSDTIGPLILV